MTSGSAVLLSPGDAMGPALADSARAARMAREEAEK